ncbi:FAD/NAD(P)-binding oxidoreductase [Ferrimicrobium sp.]|uniref:type III sulfide quinone reductase, selenoprotein subtype n=1 Tax=Ferrimicrobium sp. TaxID=2926050 RepID=UPI002602FE48|nr:FAD/NAD(P)-binding oxidoreductase [Ferrimicrobium sp.]
MRKRIVILGGGTGGTLTANRLRKALPSAEAEIIVVDQDNEHIYQPGLLFIPFGMATIDEIARPRSRQFRSGIEFRVAPIDHVDLQADEVYLGDGSSLPYDVLIVATGAVLQPEETEGLLGPGWGENIFTFYDPHGAVGLHAALEDFSQGTIAVNVVDMPIKCPVAPLEFCFLADWYFTERGIREKVNIQYITPLDGAFTKPVASKALGQLLGEKGIEIVTEYNTGQVDEGRRRLISYDNREIPYDMAVLIPAHGGSPYVGRSHGLGDDLGFITTDKHTLQTVAKENVFALGDAAGVPTSKAGSVSHFEGEIIVENVRRYLAKQPLDASFDGHSNCFIESGFHKALLIDFNYDTEPLPGHYPSDIGMPLLKESHLNHLGKLMFQSFYWHSLLPGRDIPGIGSSMPKHGKHFQAATKS